MIIYGKNTVLEALKGNKDIVKEDHFNYERYGSHFNSWQINPVTFLSSDRLL